MEKKLLEEKEKRYWAEINQAYSASKELFIKAEEKLEQMAFFPAPLLEHRDALDHIMRYYNITYENQGELTQRAIDELSDARGHEIRAYFDIADFICITIRDDVSSALKNFSGAQIKKVWNDYTRIKTEVVKISEDIVSIRNSRTTSLENIEKYKVVIEKLFNIYDSFNTRTLPELKKKYFWQFWKK